MITKAEPTVRAQYEESVKVAAAKWREVEAAWEASDAATKAHLAALDAYRQAADASDVLRAKAFEVKT